MDIAESTILVIAGGVVSSLLLLLTIRRWWPRAEPGAEAAALYGNTLGAVYGIVLAFTLAQASSAFRDAEVNAEEEANCLVSVVRIGQALPAPTYGRLGQLARDYATTMTTPLSRRTSRSRSRRITSSPS